MTTQYAGLVIDLAASVKRMERDKREPNQKEKERLQARLVLAIKRRFAKQQDTIQRRIAYLKAAPDLSDAYADDPEFEAEIVRVLLRSANLGINYVQQSTSLQLSWETVNVNAARWARQYAGRLIKEIDDTTRKLVGKVVEDFVNTPGMTMGDVIDLLPFGTARAERIAVTEITRSYAQGQMEAGQALRSEYPDVSVVKRWFTNNDDLVCDICGPLDGAEVGLDEPFDADITEPPAHPNCRCWIDTRTRIHATDRD